MNVFHHAFKVKDIPNTQKFYNGILECHIGRQTSDWIDFDFFGHQLSAHVSKDIPALDYCGTVENIKVPIPHFGCVLSPETFARVQTRLESHAVPFIIKPQIRYEGQSGEQKTLFVLDFSNNPIEFKSFTHENAVFLRE